MHAVQLKKSQNYHIQLGQAKLIHSLLSGILEIHMQVGDHFSYNYYIITRNNVLQQLYSSY